MSRPVTANPSIFRQGERMRDQRPLTSAPKVSLTPLQQFGVDNVGAGFQAALGFSMLGASGRGLPTEEQGIKEEEEADAEMAALEPTAKQASASLQSIPAFDAFSTQRQAPPVQMSEGGSLDDLGDDTGVVRYNPVVESTPTAPTPPKLNLRRQTASKAMSQIPAADGTSGKRSKESKEKEAAKGTARQQLQELQRRTVQDRNFLGIDIHKHIVNA
jgi:type IV secretory pathway VirB10-like protein